MTQDGSSLGRELSLPQAAGRYQIDCAFCGLQLLLVDRTAAANANLQLLSVDATATRCPEPLTAVGISTEAS